MTLIDDLEAARKKLKERFTSCHAEWVHFNARSDDIGCHYMEARKIEIENAISVLDDLIQKVKEKELTEKEWNCLVAWDITLNKHFKEGLGCLDKLSYFSAGEPKPTKEGNGV